MTTIGFIGLGAMGGPIAARLLDVNPVYGTNRTAAKAEGLIRRGMIWRDTPRQVAERAEVVFSMVTNDAALRAITHGPNGILAGLGPGKIYVDMSTVSPRTAAELAREVAARKARMASAPVSGSVTAAADGSLAIMVGGSSDTVDVIEPLLRQLGHQVTYVGTQSQALVLKLAINVNLAAQIVAFSEGLLFAEHAGIDPAAAANVMMASAIGSTALHLRAPLMLDLPAQPWFDIRAMHKDIRLALEAAHDLDITIVSANTALGALETAEARGFSRDDIAALYQSLRAESPKSTSHHHSFFRRRA
jgi:3-hydroxyisobutyrate dehydrogenase